MVVVGSVDVDRAEQSLGWREKVAARRQLSKCLGVAKAKFGGAYWVPSTVLLHPGPTVTTARKVHPLSPSGARIPATPFQCFTVT